MINNIKKHYLYTYKNIKTYIYIYIDRQTHRVHACDINLCANLHRSNKYIF